MLSHYQRRRPHRFGTESQRKPHRVIRLLLLGFVTVLVWNSTTALFSALQTSRGVKEGVTLTTKNGDGVKISLQGAEWQTGEEGLKLFAKDAIATRGVSDALLTFFDGTKMRLEQGSELLIEKSDHRSNDGQSTIDVALKNGRLWVVTPPKPSYTGAIVRIVQGQHMNVALTSDAAALISQREVTVLRSDGQGVMTTFPSLDVDGVFVGEGQYLRLTDDARRAIADGADPYSYRDPLTDMQRQDPFITSSYTIVAAKEGASQSRSQSGSILVVREPADGYGSTTPLVTVSGNATTSVARVLVNDTDVALRRDGTFQASIKVNSGSTIMTIIAKDSQGMTIARETRAIRYTPPVIVVAPVKIKSPVGSGETLHTSLHEVEITGEAPSGTSGIEVNGYRLQLFKAGSKTWSYLASRALGNLIQGDNIFTIVAVDGNGNRSAPRSLTIVADTVETSGSGSQIQSSVPLKQNAPLAPGSLAVTGPTAGITATVHEKEIVLEGTTTSATATISINGYQLSLYQSGKTTWNYIASTALSTMKRGRNVYRIVSRNDRGEVLDVLEYTVMFDPS